MKPGIVPAPFDVDQLSGDPVTQWLRWYDDAVAAGLPEPSAFTLGTIDEVGEPDARLVLARRVDERGFGFFTNYESAKSRQLERNPVASGVFGWLAMHRQVRIRGRITKMSSDESDDYFTTRPRGHQLSAWASPQSSVLPDRSALEALATETANRFADDAAVPRPPHWGGWRLEPSVVEFWQGQPDRLHDRLRFRRDIAGGWVVERLAP